MVFLLDPNRKEFGRPWQQTSVVKQRIGSIRDLGQGERSMADLCHRYGISRPAGYLWRERFREAGEAGLTSRSRAPKTHPNMMRPEVEDEMLRLRHSHPHGGPRKLRAWLQQRRPGTEWPAASTIGALLKREGLVVPRRKRWRHGNVPEGTS